MKKGVLVARILLDLMVALEIVLVMLCSGAIEAGSDGAFILLTIAIFAIWLVILGLYGDHLEFMEPIESIRLPFWKNGEENEEVHLPKVSLPPRLQKVIEFFFPVS